MISGEVVQRSFLSRRLRPIWFLFCESPWVGFALLASLALLVVSFFNGNGAMVKAGGIAVSIIAAVLQIVVSQSLVEQNLVAEINKGFKTSNDRLISFSRMFREHHPENVELSNFNNPAPKIILPSKSHDVRWFSAVTLILIIFGTGIGAYGDQLTTTMMCGGEQC